MKNLITLMMIAFVWLLSVSFTIPQSNDAKDKKAHDEFKILLKQTDKNNDGKISKDEYLAVFKGGEDKFKSLDENGDGFITEEEYVSVTTMAKPGDTDNKKPNDMDEEK
jgi:Ca2+-binding EF-hand superfamily protein